MGADAKSAVLSKVSSLIKIEVRNFSLLHFPRWFCLVKLIPVTCEKVSHIEKPMFLYLR